VIDIGVKIYSVYEFRVHKLLLIMKAWSSR